MVAYVCGCHCPVGCVGHLICAHCLGGHTVVVVTVWWWSHGGGGHTVVVVTWWWWSHGGGGGCGNM